ncbi:J domain-containing protein [Bacillus sp. sid0103]|uniref:J domain-containing protein n=1 Tax=Bacillaceae TaxID=186817 RepID=UPI001C4692A7|nr:J domain-containing protein [Bacillus sp. sid0103]MBV7507944.1 J domain-containing protein [Bacillus sp. sid0103]
MLNVKEVTEQLRDVGITDSEQTVIRWILEGKLKAKRTKDFNIDFLIKPKDLAAFMFEKKIESNIKQYGIEFQLWEKTFQENQKLNEEIEELKSIIRIERTKVSALKKMLKAEHALSDHPPLTFNSMVGLEAGADKTLIKKEFKKLLKALHPDRGGDERLFKVFYDHYTKTM